MDGEMDPRQLVGPPYGPLTHSGRFSLSCLPRAPGFLPPPPAAGRGINWIGDFINIQFLVVIEVVCFLDRVFNAPLLISERFPCRDDSASACVRTPGQAGILWPKR